MLAFNPGLMLDTGFVTGFAGGIVGFIARVLTPLLRILPIGRFIRSGPSSGIALAHLTTASDLPVTSAAYYDGPALKLSSAFSRSHDGATVAQQDVWTHSLRWAAVTPEERAAAGFVS